MNDLARRRVRTFLRKKQKAKKEPLFECPRDVFDGKVANLLSKFHSSPSANELYCRYLLARAKLRRRYKAKMGIEENHLCPKPPVLVKVEFQTEDNEINRDLNDMVEKAGFKLALKKEPLNGNGKIRKAYVITENKNGPSSDISKIAETLEKLLRLASDWEVQSREAAERKAMSKDKMWAAWMTVRCSRYLPYRH